ncbi:MAG: multidrug transporter AcrB [Gammaproteobacteria bacterium]|nr:multidrug transporter AcrB [Gammaproteobacteria bacterium]
MWLSDVSVKRPVFATVISLLLLAFGVLSFNFLPLREYPDINPPVVSISTSYVGASAEIIETRITQVIEDQISGIEGIKQITSSSRDGRSSVNIEFALDRDIDEAANDVRDRVSRIVGRLPEDVEKPEVAKQDSDARPIMYISLSSDRMTIMELDDYARRYLEDRFAVIPGVAAVSVNGGRPAMRIWLDRLALAARNLTVSDIEAALRRENLELPAGRLESSDREFQVRLERSYNTPQDFRNLVLDTADDGTLVRLGEVARVELAPQNLRESFRANQKTTVGLGIVKQSTANTLETLEAVKAEIARVNQTLPEHMEFIASSDDSLFIREAIDSVYQTIIATTVLVSLVILAFLGTFRTMVIPAVTIPVCLTAAFIALAAFGYSVNLITLLALVLSIGLVVDDAIVVLENIHRRIENGEPPLLAAFNGSRQVAFAVVATTAVLVAVFTPIVFLADNMGVIFSELAVTICAAVIFSSVLALSLTPVMCSKILSRKERKNPLTRLVERAFARLESGYRTVLTAFVRRSWLAIPLTLAVFGALAWLFDHLPDEYAPAEDQGIFMARIQAPEGTGIERMRQAMNRIEQPLIDMQAEGLIARTLVRIPGWGSSAPNSGVAVVTMVPWQERDVTTAEAAARATAAWQSIPFVQAFAFSRSGLSRGGGNMPVQFVLGGPNYDELARWRDLVEARAAEWPGIERIDSDLKETQPQVVVRIDKNRAAALGVSVQNVGRTLSAMMSEQRVTTFVQDGEEYDVLLQAREDQRATARDLSNIYVRSESSGELIPLANLIYLEETAGAGVLNRYNRLRAVTLSASLAPGYSLGEALEFLEGVVRDELPEVAQVDYKGESLEFKEAAGSLLFTFGIALLIVFLVLAAQFESFVHPLVIILTVPLAMAGAMLGLYLTGNSINIYSQIGLVMLIGIAAKNGVLIVEFINQLRDAGRDFEAAIIEAAGIRLRPVIMTTLSTAIGALPLLFALGAGAESRNVLGVVIFSGVTVASLLTLFVVPAFYHLLARRSGSPEAVAREIERLSTHRAESR